MGEHVGLRLDDKTVATVDALAKHLSQPWHAATRSDALRAALDRGLASWAAEVPSLAPVTVVHAEAPTELRPKRKVASRPRRSKLAADVALKAKANAALEEILKGKGV